jgi:DNA invertase Pin-like site-specific DNA recombinase
MSDRKFVAYYRVSTARQGRSGLGLDAQKQAVRGYLAGAAGNLIGEHTEVESGKRTDRPELDKALSACRIHGATLVIAKLDRLARNVEFIASLMNGCVDFIAADMPHANRLTVHIIAAMAEHEREMISARTKAALAQARGRGVKLGGDRGNIDKIASAGGKASGQVRREAAAKRARDLLPIIDEIRNAGVLSLGGIARQLTEKGIPNVRGLRWHPAQIARIEKFARA